MSEKKSPFCTLTDKELIEKATELVQQLIDTGGKSWVLNIPARPNADPDLIFTELNYRFKNLIERPQHGAVWVKASTFAYVAGDTYHAKDDNIKGAGRFDAAGNFTWGHGSFRPHYAQDDLLILDESPAEQPVKPTIWDVGNAFQWAAEYGNEKGEQLILSEDGQWMLLSEEGGVTETDELTPSDLAELYLLQRPDAVAEQPGREVIVKATDTVTLTMRNMNIEKDVVADLKAEIDRRNKLLEDDLKRDCRLNMPGISEQEQEAAWQAFKTKHNL